MRVALVCLLLAALAAPAEGHHSWFSKTWRWMTGAKESGDQCLVSCSAESSDADAGTCGMMWTSLVEVLTGRSEPLPPHLLNGRRKRSVAVLSEVEARAVKRRACCFLTEFPQATSRCCTLLRGICNAMPYGDDEDSGSRLTKLTGGIRKIADKIGVNIDDLGLSFDEKMKAKEELVQ